MCGRYAAGKERDALALEFEVDAATNRMLPPRWNIAPTAPIYIVKDEQSALQRIRHLDVAMWGLVPRWAADMSIGAKMANARCETVATKPSFRAAFARQRCLIPVDGWYEWAAADMSVPARIRPPKQPYYFRAGTDRSVSAALAGIYEWWRDPSQPDAPPLLSAAIITTDAYGHLADVHSRTPVIVGRDQWDAWLDPDPAAPAPAVLESVLNCLQSIPVVIHPVSTRVNSARSDDEGMIEPVVVTPASPAAADPSGMAVSPGPGEPDPDQLLLF
ncbi:MAG: hypothetical protein RL745_278 [Actinomycetota bacterium]|jgi:putative SOS response-associated peptidase YedK